MNRTDRLLAIVLELQGKGKQRAEDLAATFEVSKRTVYRDVEALCQAGVPVVSVPGQGYSLVAGYFLPPLSFSSEEAVMLLLGSTVMAQSFDAQYQTVAQAASRKIAGVLSPKLREEVQYLQENIQFVAPDAGFATSLLPQLRQAVLDRRTVRFIYHTRLSEASNGNTTLREADPHGLIHVSDAWYLIAYCHLRQGIRHFRLDRIDNLTLLNKTFVRQVYSRQSAEEREQQRQLVVRVQFDHEVARWVREARYYYVVAEEETSEGLLMTMRVRQESEVVQWLLSWGRHVEVLEPASLRQRLAEEAAAILQNHQIKEPLLT